MPPYAALVIAYRRPDLIQAVLRGLAAQTVTPTVVFVVDNGGDLPAAALDVESADFEALLIRRPDNPGYSVAVNEARRTLSGRDIPNLLVLTHDAAFGPTLAESLLQGFDSRENAGAIGPVLYRASARDRLFSAGGKITGGGRARHDMRLPAPEEGGWRDVAWLDGAIVMFRRQALDDIDWLDERYFLYFEDVDTGWRLRRAGYRNLVRLEETAYQDPGAHPTYLGIRNMTLFGRTAGISPVRTAAAVSRRVAEESVVAVLDKRRPPLRQAWRGWVDGRAGKSGKPPESPRPGA